MTSSQTTTIPVALVNGVYFPTQRLRFKVNDPSRQIFNLKDGFYGIVSKRQVDEVTSENEQIFKDHHSIGVLVKITD